MNIINKIVMTPKVKYEVPEDLLKELMDKIFTKRIELDLANRNFDYLQIIELDRADDIDGNYIIHRQEDDEYEDVISFKDKVISKNIPGCLIGKKIYFKFDYLYDESHCTILFSDEW